jgi:probable HAF family extracellular repeat protein
MTDLGQPYGSSTYASGVNDAGQVVGEADSATQVHGYIFQNGTFTDLRPLGIREANAINFVGQVAGKNINAHAVLYSGGSATDLGTLGGTVSTAIGINNSGMVVGESEITFLSSVTHAFLYVNGQMTDLGSLGGTFCSAGGISPDGTMITGSGWTVPFQPGGPNTRHAFLYSNGVMHDLGTFGGRNSGAGSNPNSQRQFVGYADVVGDIDHAFLYSNGTMSDLNSMVDGSAAGWTLSDTTGINDFGWIAGYGMTPGGQTHAFVLTPLPEPSGAGIVVTIIVICKRRTYRKSRGAGVLRGAPFGSAAIVH